ncbi:hypothetical protein ACROYT_G015400 [Oculina patagonica]
MDAVCLQATWNENLSNLPKDISDDKLTMETVVSERARVADLSASEHALLEAGLVLKRMARESKQEKINAVYKAQFNGGQTELARKLDAIEKELDELKRAVSEVEKYVLEKVAEGEKLRRELPSMHDKDEKNELSQEQFQTITDQKGGFDTELLKGKDYFEAQSSWFDLLANNIGCLDIQFNPVLKKEKKHHNEESRIVGNTSHYNADTPSERINAEDYFDVQPSWFDTLLNNTGCLDIEFSPVPKGQKEKGESRNVHSIPCNNAGAITNILKDDVCGPKACLLSITPAASEPKRADRCFSLSTRYLFVDSEEHSATSKSSWFDTVADNIGCLEIKNFPVLTEDIASEKEYPFSKEIQGTIENSSLLLE